MSEDTYKTYREQAIELIEAVCYAAGQNEIARSHYNNYEETDPSFERLQQAKLALIDFICGEGE